jgi:hypothetical protein
MLLELAVEYSLSAHGGDKNVPLIPSGKIVLDVKWRPIEPLLDRVV